ncbi:DNA-binding transcriptional LysR family regulator [Nocardiopsis sp. Huas11]|uniref:LysR family transcriptional regulator n=1 Tax=Nocardiopsis sp. Huas11 TaxID=2183912 RepID=UPI000EABF247|nr:LysR family transcriptional regulator [Nocardiopsis sp. Huas11]RKS07189.1 DNA-binding transcriptional LysR family regulator [Nocardiopsis sp. Huas11]
MDVRRLGYFLAVVDQGGFGRAAEHLLIAQPSLSQAISGLERELGVQLFHRVGRGVVLSDAGRQLVEPARRVLRDVEAARAVIDSVQGLQRGRVHLVTTPSPGIEPLATLTASLQASHPGLLVDIAAAFTREEVMESVRTGATELGLLASPGPVRTADLSVLHLEHQQLVLLSPAGADLPGTVKPGDLDERPMVVSPPGSLLRALVDDLLAGGARVRITAQVAHRTSVLPLVLAGVGHAVVPSSWTTLARSAGAQVRTLRPTTYLKVSLVSRSDGLTPAARAFIDTARAYADQAS